MRSRWKAAVLAVLLLTACGDEDPALEGMVRTPPLDVSEVTLPDADGDAVPMRAPDGGLLLVYFGYTSCPDICPTTMAEIGFALDELPAAQRDRVTVAMTTVDPERDTAEVLSRYLGHFFERNSLALRTTDAAELDEAAAAFDVRYEVEAHEPGERYDVGHSAITYVVDDTGSVVVEWPFGFDSKSMASDLRTLLHEEDQQ